MIGRDSFCTQLGALRLNAHGSNGRRASRLQTPQTWRGSSSQIGSSTQPGVVSDLGRCSIIRWNPESAYAAPRVPPVAVTQQVRILHASLPKACRRRGAIGTVPDEERLNISARADRSGAVRKPDGDRPRARRVTIGVSERVLLARSCATSLALISVVLSATK